MTPNRLFKGLIIALVISVPIWLLLFYVGWRLLS